jgi:PAS domain S-box-containing protein
MNGPKRGESEKRKRSPASHGGGQHSLSSAGTLERKCTALRERLARLLSKADRNRTDLETVRQSESKYRELVEDSCSIILRMDVQGNVTFANPHALAFFGYTKKEILGKNVVGTIVPVIERSGRNLAELIRDICDHPERYQDNENENVQQDGTSKWIAWTNKGICDAAGRPKEILCIGNDITARKEAEEALQQEQSTLRHLLESQQHDLHLVAYEIHDSLSQLLVGAKMQFDAFDGMQKGNPKSAQKTYQNGRGLLNRAIAETRRLIANLRPPDLDTLGIIDAVKQWIDEQGSHLPFKVELIGDAPFQRLDSFLEHALFRIVQEGIRNAARHSASGKIRIAFQQRRDGVSVEIKDWGQGFDTSAVGPGHFGLKSICERARILGGKASIESARGQGTQITVQLPLNSEKKLKSECLIRRRQTFDEMIAPERM